jgi:hypothetical protein
MAMRDLAKIADAFMRGGLPPNTPAAMVDERIVVSTLDRVAADAQEHQLGTSSIIVIEKIVNVRERLIDAVLARLGQEQESSAPSLPMNKLSDHRREKIEKTTGLPSGAVSRGKPGQGHQSR